MKSTPVHGFSANRNAIALVYGLVETIYHVSPLPTAALVKVGGTAIANTILRALRPAGKTMRIMPGKRSVEKGGRSMYGIDSG